MKKELGHVSRTITVHHFFTFLNFVILFISVACLSVNVYILRREIESVKADIRPLEVKENEKTASQLYDDYFVKSRKARQNEPGSHEMGPGPHEIEPAVGGENATEDGMTPHGVDPGAGGENATESAEPTEGEMTPHGVEPGAEGENATESAEPTEGEMTPHGVDPGPEGGEPTTEATPEQHGATAGATKLNCSKVHI